MTDANSLADRIVQAEQQGELVEYILNFDFNFLEDEAAFLLQDLHNSSSINIISRSNTKTLVELDQSSFFSIFHVFTQVIPKIKCPTNEIVTFVTALTQKVGTNLAINDVNRSFIYWCEENISQAREIIAKALALQSAYIEVLTFATIGLKELDVAFEQTQHSETRIKIAGFWALGAIEVQDNTKLTSIIDRCSDAENSENSQEVRKFIINTMFRTWGKMKGKKTPYRQARTLKSIIQKNDQDELAQLAAMLSLYLTEMKISIANQILRALKKATSNHHTILENVDSTLYKNSNRLNINLVIEVFANNISLSNENFKSNDFHNFETLISDNRLVRSAVVSKWLLSGQIKLSSYVSSIFDRDDVIEIIHSDLPKSDQDQILLVKRCVTHFFIYPIAAASVLLCVIKNGNKSIREEVESLLYDPLLLSYSSELNNYLKSRRKDKSSRISKCIESTLKKHSAYIRDLQKVQHIVELTPSSGKRRVAALRERALHAEIQKNAHSRSFFASMMTRQVLLYGGKTMSMTETADGTRTTQIIPMGEHSYSTEFPRLAVVDPIGLDMMLLSFRVEK